MALNTDATTESENVNPLVRSAMEGDESALNELFAHCMPRLQKTASRILRNAQDSEDALQDGLLSGVRHLSKFQGRAQFSTWMHSIVSNAAKSIIRRQTYHPLVVSIDEPQPDHGMLTFADAIGDPREALEGNYCRREKVELLASIIEKLPPGHRAIICLCDLQGCSMQQAATHLGISVAAEKTSHLRAMRFLNRVAANARERNLPVLDALAELTSAAAHA